MNNIIFLFLIVTIASCNKSDNNKRGPPITLESTYIQIS